MRGTVAKKLRRAKAAIDEAERLLAGNPKVKHRLISSKRIKRLWSALPGHNRNPTIARLMIGTGVEFDKACNIVSGDVHGA